MTAEGTAEQGVRMLWHITGGRVQLNNSVEPTGEDLQRLQQACGLLSARHQQILSGHFGIGTHKSTLEAIGQTLPRLDKKEGVGINKARVEHEKAKALRQLRALLRPLPEDSLGRNVWGVSYPVEMTEQFPHIDLLRLKTDALNLSNNTLRELGKHWLVNYAINRTSSFPSLLALELERPLSDSVRAELIDRVQELETFNRLINSPVPRTR